MSGPILVAGAGIGGLAAAVALRAAGHETLLIERAPEIRELGAGITVQINGTRALRRLGVADRVASLGAVVREASIRSWDGTVLSTDPLADLAIEYGTPCVGIHRGRLQGALLEAVTEQGLLLGKAVTGLSQDASGVTVSLDDGSTLRGSLLIGADGIRSTVRAALHGPSDPDYAGYSIWRAICARPASVPADIIRVYWGPSCRFGFVPISASEVYWYCTQVEPEHVESEHSRQPDDVLASLLARHHGWDAPVTDLIAATHSSALFRTPIADRPALPSWGQGRITLLGDAAHPMTPNLGQGACQALEDAVALASCLSAHGGDHVAALRAYERLRMPRAHRVVEIARDLGRRGHTPTGWQTAQSSSDRPLGDTLRRWLYDEVAA